MRWLFGFGGRLDGLNTQCVGRKTSGLAGPAFMTGHRSPNDLAQFADFVARWGWEKKKKVGTKGRTRERETICAVGDYRE